MKVVTLRYRRSVILSLCIGLLWFVVPSYFFVIKDCSIRHDSLLSPAVCEVMSSYIKNHCLERPFQSLLLSSIKQQFPYVAQIDAYYSYPGILSCICKALNPRLVINEKYLFMDDTSIHLCENYAGEVCKKLPTITFAQKEITNLSEECCRCLSKISLELFEQFSLYWVDETSLYLRDKANPALIVRSDIHSIFDERLIAKYKIMKNEITSQRNYAKKEWMLDMRFKNQVIIAQKGMEGL